MKTPIKVMILNLPSPPYMDVKRDYSGGYGTAERVKRKDYGHGPETLFPVFLPYLASAINKSGYEIKILDAQVMRLNSEQVVSFVKKENPDFLVSMLSLPSIYGDISLLNEIKEALSEISIVGVGTVCKTLNKEILEKSKIDFIVKREYPFYSNSIITLIQSTEKNKFQKEKTESLDDLNFHIYDLFPIKKYKLFFDDIRGKDWNYFPIITGKGCPFSCIYCPYPLGFGNKIYYKSIEKLIDEIEYLTDNFDVVAFLFRDQVFTSDEKRVEKICDSILERNLEIKWLFETRVDRISGQLLKKMSKAGCNRIHYGVETGDAKLLKSIGKPGVNAEIIRKVFALTKEEDILTMAHVIIGLPGENEETLKNTYNFISSLNPDQVSFNLITPYPGTKLFELAKEERLILTYDWSRYSTGDAVMRSDKLNAEELLKARNEMEKKFQRKKLFEFLGRIYEKKTIEFLIRRSMHHLKNLQIL